MAETKPKIYEAISNVMKDVGVVGKNDKNDFDHYKFRGIDAVMNALNPAMIKNNVFVTPTVLEAKREERVGNKGTNMMYSILTVKYTFYTTDGSSLDCVVIGEAMDRSDKSTNKAMSAAFKYACFQTFCIPTEEMKDSESESLEIGETVNKDLVPHNESMTKERIAKLRNELKRTGNDEKALLGYYKIKDFKEMTEAQYISCINTLAKKPDKTNENHVNENEALNG